MTLDTLKKNKTIKKLINLLFVVPTYNIILSKNP